MKKDLIELEIVNNKIAPFPKSDFEKFSLGEIWFLPQDLVVLKQLTGIKDLSFDFSIKSLEEQALYREVYRSPWNGDLGLLFYRRSNNLWASLLPGNFTQHKLLQHWPEKELVLLESTIKSIVGLQNRGFDILDAAKRKI